MMLSNYFKVVRFTKDFHVATGELWFAKGEEVLLINQTELQTQGNTGWCIVPQNAENWNGCTLPGHLFEEREFFKHTDIDPKTHPSYKHVVQRFSDQLNDEENLLKDVEAQVARLRESISVKRRIVLEPELSTVRSN